MSKSKAPVPLMPRPVFETHFHLDRLKQTASADCLSRAQSVGVEKFLTIAVEPDNLAETLALAQQYPNVFASQGIHPHDADQYTDQVAAHIQTNLNHEKVLAVGEIGLDYYYDHSDRATQRQVFSKQLEIAIEADLPVVIHTREADQDTREILQAYAPQLQKKGVIHSFTSSIELAEWCLQAGFYLGFNGIITFNKADNVREVLKITPIERILSETDAPYLTPAPYRGQENQPYFLPMVLLKIAEVKQLPIEIVLEHCWQNAHQLFELPIN